MNYSCQYFVSAIAFLSRINCQNLLKSACHRIKSLPTDLCHLTKLNTGPNLNHLQITNSIILKGWDFIRYGRKHFGKGKIC